MPCVGGRNHKRTLTWFACNRKSKLLFIKLKLNSVVSLGHLAPEWYYSTLQGSPGDVVKAVFMWVPKLEVVGMEGDGVGS